MDITFRLLDPEELPIILPLVAILNPSLPADVLAQRLEHMRHHGYRCMGGFGNNTLVAMCGLWSGTKFYCGRYMEVDNVFVHPAQRCSGIGQRMMESVEILARKEGCDVLMLDTYVTNTRSHKFYTSQDFETIGYHMNKNLDGSRYFAGK